jgi:glycosyltransferase involved in cell wall biosynthesis
MAKPITCSEAVALDGVNTTPAGNQYQGCNQGTIAESWCGASVVVVDPSCFTLPYDYSLCNALVKHGCKVVLAQSEFLYADWDLPRSFAVWKHFYQRSHRPARSRGLLWKIAKGAEHVFSMRSFAAEIARRKTDIVHFQWLPVPILDQFYLPALSASSRLVLTLHNTSSFHGSWFAQLHQKAGLARVLRYFDAIIVHTEFGRAAVLKQGWAAPEKVHVVPHAVLDYYRAYSTPQASQDQEMRVLFFGNIEPYKGLNVLLAAFAQLPEQLRRRTRLVIAGRPGCDVSELSRLSRALGIEDRVQWDLRFIPERELTHLFHSATVVALPYLEIDQSGVLLTAIGFGKPIVATRIGGIPETIQDGIHGVLVEPGNASELAGGLERLLVDPSCRLSMQGALHELRMGPLSWNKSASKTVEIYNCLLNGSANPAGCSS